MNRKALGKGLDALISKEAKTLIEGETKLLKISEIQFNLYQPRSNPEENLEELVNSIKEKGVLQPIVVRRSRQGYELVFGERRLRAAKLAGLEEIPAVIRELSQSEMLELALIENLHRENLNPIEEALAYKRLIDEFDYTHEEIAEKVGKDRATISNALRLLTLGPKIREYLAAGLLTVGHAKILLSLNDRKAQESWAEKIINEGISVRKLESLLQAKRKKTKHGKEKDPYLEDCEDKLSKFLGTKVKIHKKFKVGSIVIDFYSDEDLNRIINLLLLR